MLSFASPFWLLAFVPLGVLGLLVLRRQRAVRVALPTLRFFPRDDNASAGRARRDWRWLPLVLAALLIPLTLAEPVWNATLASEPLIQMYATARRIPGTTRTEIFVRIVRPDWIAPDEGISVIRSDHEVDPAVPMPAQALRADALETGMIFEEPIADRLFIVLTGRRGTLASTVLVRKKTDSFLIDMRASSPLLERVLRIQPGASRTATRRVLIVDAASGHAVPAPADGELLIALGRVPLEGIHFAEQELLTSEKIQSVAKSILLENVFFGDAHAGTIATAGLDSPWQVLAQVQGHPFLAIRQDANGSQVLWIASPLRDGNWPLQPSFVVFFTNVVSDWQTSPHQRADEWDMQSEPITKAASPVSFSTATGVAALFCMLMGTALLMIKK